MKVDLFLAADYANITGDGKLNVMGIFRIINATSFPARHSSMHLVIKMVPELGEFGVTRNLFVKLHAPDGNELMEMSGKIEVPVSKGGLAPEVNVILELKDLRFPEPGPYQFVVLVDKDYKGDLPIMVNKIDPPAVNQV
jgi:hypothetical protein